MAFVSRLIGLSLAVAAAALVAPSASAELVLGFGKDDVAGGDSFSVQAGDSITLDLYLTQQGQFRPNPQFEPTRFVDDERLTLLGLGSAAFTFNAETRSGSVDPAIVDFAFGPGLFDDGQSTFSTRTMSPSAFGELTEGNLSVTPVKAPYKENANSILLGKVTLTTDRLDAGSLELGLRTFSEGNFDDTDPPPDFGIGSNPNNSVLVSSGSATLQVTAIPEPSQAMAVAGLASIVGGSVLVRRRKRSKCQRAAC